MNLQTDFFEKWAYKYLLWIDEKWTYTFSNWHPYFGMITVTLALLLYFNQKDIKYIVTVGVFIVASFITGYASLIQNEGAIPYHGNAAQLLNNHRLYASLLVASFILVISLQLISMIHAKFKDIANLNKFLYIAIIFFAIELIYTGKEMVFKYAIGVMSSS